MLMVYNSYLYDFHTFCQRKESLILAKGKHLYGMNGGKHIFGTVKVGEKGQIVIPKDAREVFGICPGDTLLILGDERNGIIVTRPDVINEAAKKVFENIEEGK